MLVARLGESEARWIIKLSPYGLQKSGIRSQLSPTLGPTNQSVVVNNRSTTTDTRLHYVAQSTHGVNSPQSPSGYFSLE